MKYNSSSICPCISFNSLQLSPEHSYPGFLVMKNRPVYHTPDKNHTSLQLVPGNNNKAKSKHKKVPQKNVQLIQL